MINVQYANCIGYNKKEVRGSIFYYTGQCENIVTSFNACVRMYIATMYAIYSFREG